MFFLRNTFLFFFSEDKIVTTFPLSFFTKVFPLPLLALIQIYSLLINCFYTYTCIYMCIHVYS